MSEVRLPLLDGTVDLDIDDIADPGILSVSRSQLRQIQRGKTYLYCLR